MLCKSVELGMIWKIRTGPFKRACFLLPHPTAGRGLFLAHLKDLQPWQLAKGWWVEPLREKRAFKERSPRPKVLSWKLPLLDSLLSRFFLLSPWLLPSVFSMSAALLPLLFAFLVRPALTFQSLLPHALYHWPNSQPITHRTYISLSFPQNELSATLDDYMTTLPHEPHTVLCFIISSLC